MKAPSSNELLAGRVAEFEDELRQLAGSIVRQVVAEEIARRRGWSGPSVFRGGSPEQLDLPLVERAITPLPGAEAAMIDLAAADQPAQSVPAAAAPSDEAASNAKKRRPWTRERVVDELAQWILTMPSLDAASIGRRGGTALVNAARREFGRFEAAMNAANVALARRFPDGVPKPGQVTAS